MKILIYGMSSNHGGVESFIYNYTRHFGSEVIVDFVTDFQSIPFENELKKDGSKIFKLPSRRGNYRAYKKALRTIFEENHYDVVWANVCTLSSVELLEFAKKVGVQKRIIHSHNSQNMGGKVTKLLHAYNSLKLKSIATDFWACSPEAGAWMYGNRINSNDVVVINNAIFSDDYTFNPNKREEIRNEMNLKDSFVIGHVGRLHHQKNQGYLLDIFKEIVQAYPNSQLLIIGSGELEGALNEKIKHLNLESNVQMLGQRSDVKDLMQAFDIFLLPSRFEGLPFVLVEAQAAGLPSFTTRKYVSSEAKITDLLTYIDRDVAPSVWSRAILEAKGMERRNMKDEIVAAGFDIESEAQKVLELFKK